MKTKYIVQAKRKVGKVYAIGTNMDKNWHKCNPLNMTCVNPNNITLDEARNFIDKDAARNDYDFRIIKVTEDIVETI